jgi:hypothetical protein
MTQFTSLHLNKITSHRFTYFQKTIVTQRVIGSNNLWSYLKTNIYEHLLPLIFPPKSPLRVIIEMDML